MTLLKRISQIAVELESVEGTAETLVDADATMLCYAPTYTPDVGRFNRDPARSSLSRLDAVIGRQMARLAWRTELKGSGAVGTAPAWADAITACGFQELAVSTLPIGTVTSGPFTPGETVTGGTSSATATVVGETEHGDSVIRVINVSGTFDVGGETITGGSSGASTPTSAGVTTDQGFCYIPDSTTPSSATVARYMNGMRQMIHGARGNVRVACVGGEPAFLDFDFLGVYNAPTDTAVLSPTYETTVPPAFLSVGFMVQDYSPCFGALDVDMANVLTPRECASQSTGVISTFITDRDPGGSIDPEMALVATHDFYGKFIAGTTGYLASEWGSSAGNTIVVAAPRVQYANVGDGDRGGLALATLDLEFKSTLAGGDDEIQIAMV